MLNRWLFTQIDNSALVVFRIIFGLLLALQAFSDVALGWVRRSLIAPQETFNFIGFEFLQPLPGDGMIYYYLIMGLFGLLVMVGYKYRFSIIAFTIMWSGVYLMQKTSYNNHYYLLMLLGIIMTFLPANRYASIDAWKNPKLRAISMPRWVWLVIVLQLWIVYTYASVAKLYLGWFDGSFFNILLRSKQHYWMVGEFLQEKWVHTTMAWFGFLFDLTTIPLFLNRKTRIPAFIAAIFFHLFNSFIFHIGIFPYLSLAFALFFFSSERINKNILRGKKKFYTGNEIKVPAYRNLLIIVLGIWFILQIGLPLRHWFFKDDVLWTEEGHRLSWRMMLRAKSGRSTFKVVERGTRDTIIVQKTDYLTPKQNRAINSKPDLIWQFAQRLKREYAKKGKDVQVFADARVSVNGQGFYPFTDPKVDLANEPWYHFKHNDWILPSQFE
ncbi:HTTM domain-containing protein [Gillisia sp. Hel_I_29]|uniref:HTTM domain-containing protein n=1 Tax=Gillisia sp. Hel_I_29 TaxID=1249975 RepID=UPI0005544236|nr:HTTM domain-containing protein [Gillisia sp. Hel_I_29]